MTFYPESAIAYQFDDPPRRSPLWGRKLSRLAVVDGVLICRCGRGPVEIFSRRKCKLCCNEDTRRYRANRKAAQQAGA